MRTLVLGIGNVLMGDEAVGVHVANVLACSPLPPNVEVLDGGTGGFHLLSCLTDFDTVVIVDATMDGRPAGTVSVVQPRYASDFPRSLTAHDIGLRDLIECAAVLRGLPRLFLVTVSVEALQPMETRLSRAVRRAIAEAASAVVRLLEAQPTDTQCASLNPMSVPMPSP